MSGNVNLTATGQYLRLIREARGLTREHVAAEAGTSASQIERIENGKQETRSSVMLGIIKAINANVDQVTWLMHTPDAKSDDAQRLAQAWIEQTRLLQHPDAYRARIEAIVQSMPPEDLAAIVEELRKEEDADIPGILTLFRVWLAGWRAHRSFTPDPEASSALSRRE